MKQNKETNHFYYERTGKEIEYLDFEMMKERYPDGNYNVVGEIDVNEKESIGIGKQLRYKEDEIVMQPLGKYKSSRYKLLGYIPCEYDEYVLVKQKTNKKIFAGLLIAFLIVMALLGGVFFMNKGNKQDIDPNAGDYTSALKRPENIGSSKILIPGYGKFMMKKDSDTIETVLFNPEENPCYFKFTLVETKTDEVLYESKLVPPGKGITPVKLQKAFDQIGSYDVTLRLQTFDLEDTSINYNGSDTAVQLIVEE